MSGLTTEQSIPAVDYHKLPGISNSRLSDFIIDPRLYYYKWLSGQYRQPSKDHFDFGSAVHEIALLGSSANIVVIPDSVLSKSGSRAGGAWKEFEADNKGKLLLKPHDFTAVTRCVQSIYEHPVASKLLTSEGVAEKMHEQDDETLGLKLRCRPDRLLDCGIVLDIKTTQSTRASSFVKSVANFGYARQEYFYRRVLEANGIDVYQFIFIAVSVEQPHTVDCYTLSEDFRRYGETAVETALGDLAERTRNNDWNPRTLNKVVELSPPKYLHYESEYSL